MGKLTISMAIFNSYFDITRGYSKNPKQFATIWSDLKEHNFRSIIFRRGFPMNFPDLFCMFSLVILLITYINHDKIPNFRWFKSQFLVVRPPFSTELLGKGLNKKNPRIPYNPDWSKRKQLQLLKIFQSTCGFRVRQGSVAATGPGPRRARRCHAAVVWRVWNSMISESSWMKIPWVI